MWVLKLKRSAKNTFFAAVAKRYGVNFSGYPVSQQTVDDYVIVRVAGFVEGEQSDIERFVKAVRKERSVLHVGCKRSFVLAELRFSPAVKVLYRPEILFVQPAQYSKDGTELVELASWEKEPLMEVLEFYKHRAACTVLGFSQRKIDNIGLISVHPDLTDKQRHALQLAVAHGYYAFPRKITLEKLARIMGVSFSTYQAHLAKAEAKFINEMAGKFL